MTNYVPIPGMQIPQAGQMMNQPAIQVQQPLVGHNPLVNPLRDISGRNRTIEDVFNDRKQLREEQYNRQKEETEKRLKEQFGKMEEEMGKKVHDMFVKKQESKLDPYFSTPFDEDEEEQGDLPIIPKIREGQQPTPKKFLQTNEPEEEKVPGSNKLQVSRSKYTDEEKQAHLSQDDYYRLLTLEQEYNDGILTTDSSRYKQLKNLRSKISKNKKSGKTF